MSRRDYFELFLEEARELWRAGGPLLERGALDEELRRIVHTVKGMSATMGYQGLADACHRLEQELEGGTGDGEVRRLFLAIGEALDEAAALGSPEPLQRFATEAGGWWELEVAPTEPMPQVRLRQWLAQLERWGLTRTEPPFEELLKEPRGRHLRVHVPDEAALSRLHRLPRLGRIERVAAGEAERGPSSLRVALTLVNELFDEIGQLHTRLRILRTVPPGSRAWEREMREVQALVARALHHVSAARLSRLEPLMQHYREAAEAAARAAGKEVVVETAGGDLRIAREVVERLFPLIPHVARNAVAHGIESPEERRARGKEPVGRLGFRARSLGAYVRLELTDDGRGVDPEELRARLAAAGEAVARIDDGLLLELLTRSGFSTRAQADGLAGRGVGLDAVRATVEAAGGRLAVRNRPGEGFGLIVDLPAPLSLQPVIEVRLGEAVVGILDGAWRLRRQPPPEGASGWSLPGLTCARPRLWLERDGAYLAVDGAEEIGNVFLHPVRHPLARIPGTVGYYLDRDGRPRLVMEPVPEGAGTGGSWSEALAVLDTVVPHRAPFVGAAPEAEDPEPQGVGWRWRSRDGEVGLLFVGLAPAELFAELVPATEAPADPTTELAEVGNWLLTRLLERMGVDAETLVAAGPIELVTTAPASETTEVRVVFHSARTPRLKGFLWRSGTI